jgi:signal transduction histidine kinase
MLQDFVAENRLQIISRCKANSSTTLEVRSTDEEFEHGVPLFLSQLERTLRHGRPSVPEVESAGARHGEELLNRGFTVAQVVRDYGGVCQAVTDLAIEKAVEISALEFKTLNLCLDDAIAGAVAEYGQLRENQGVERLGYFAHELRNLLTTSVLAFQILRSGRVGVSGSTGSALDRSLSRMRSLVDRELTEVRLISGVDSQESIAVRDLLEDVKVSATLDAQSRGIPFSVVSSVKDETVKGDRQILASVLANLLQNAFKFTKPDGEVSLRVEARGSRVLFEVQDACGGLPEGKAQDLFRPFTQKGDDRTGLGLGLAICQQGVRASAGELRVVNQPGRGCLFVVDLPKHERVPNGV